MINKIDFIVTWVDETDVEWLQNKKRYQYESEIYFNDKLNTSARFRNWDNLKYWFRAVEKYAPWVNKIFFVTEGHVPDWLDTNHQKLKIIKHSDFIDSSYLPTFNSNVIELNFVNIEELSEHFVSFNDDMFINDTVTPKDFFKKSRPCDSGVFSPIIPMKGTIDSIILNNIEVINDNFKKKTVVNKNFWKFYNWRYGKHLFKNMCVSPWDKILGFYDNHIPISYNKNTFEVVWEKEAELLKKTCENRFRTNEDISHWLMRYWQLCEGNFSPRKTNFGAYYNIGIDLEKMIRDIEGNISKVICLNDNDMLKDYFFAKNAINEAFEKKYQCKSSFER